MKKRIINKYFACGILFILMTMSIIPIQASENKNVISPRSTQENGDNILGYITIEWDSWFAGWNFNILKPNINYSQSDTREFYFDEIDGIIQMNFTIVCRMRLINFALFPRWAQLEFYLPSEEPRVFNALKVGFCGWSLKWKYFNITVGPDGPEYINPLVTNGSNATLIPKVGVRPIFGENFSFWFGNYTVWEPVTVVPRPILQ